MPRVISVHLPRWSLDAHYRRQPGSPPRPELAVAARRERGRRLVHAVTDAARARGLHVGMPLATATAATAGLSVIDADLPADAADLVRLAGWARRFSPLVALSPPDGLWILADGTAHLHGGERAMLEQLVRELAELGIAARAAIAPAAGAAHALARFAPGPVRVCHDLAEVLPLPVEALRVDDARMLKRLRYLGLDTIGQVAALPRAPVRKRFGAQFCIRLEHALGQRAEVLQPLPLPPGFSASRRWPDPVANADLLRAPVAALVRRLCGTLSDAGAAIIRLRLTLGGESGERAVPVELRTPSRDEQHLIRVLDLKLAALELDEGVTGVTLSAGPDDWLDAVDSETADPLRRLCDRLSARLGDGQVFGLRLLQSEMYELATARVAAPQPEVNATLGGHGPARLFQPGEPVTLSRLTEGAGGGGGAVRWRGRTHAVVRETGAEQVLTDWWNAPLGMPATIRHYHEVEIQSGERLWLTRDLPIGPDPAGAVDTAWRCLGVSAL